MRKRQRLARILILLALGASGLTASAAPVSFQKQVRVILQRRCQGCHQPANRGGKLDVTSFRALKAGGDHGTSFVPGKPEESLLVKFIAGKEPLMPKGGPPLPAAEVALIRRWIAEGARDDTVAVKDRDDARPPVYTAPPVISALAFSPDGSMLAVAGYREVLLHKADGSGLIARLVGASDRIESLAFSPDGAILAAVGGAPARFGEVQFWDVAARRLLRAVRTTYDSLYGAAFSPDGTMLAFGAADHTARILTVPDGKELLKFENHSDWVLATAFSRDGKHVITAGRDRAIKLVLIEGPNGSFVDDINKHYEGLLCMARHPSEDQVVVAGFDGVPRLYRVFREKARTMNNEDHNLIREFERQPGPVNAVAFSPDGERLAVAGVDGEARVYDVKRDAAGRALAAEGSRSDALARLGGGRGHAASEGAGATPSATGAPVVALKGHEGAIFTLAFDPKGAVIATGGFDGRVRLFDAKSGALRNSFIPVPLQPTKTVGTAASSRNRP